MSPSPTKRPRGAPPSNLNALKHGFYSRQLKKTDVTDLEAAKFTGLQDEINLLRVYIRRVIQIGEQTSDLSEALGILRVLCFASTSLTRLLKTQAILAAGTDEITLALRQAIEAVNREFAASNPDTSSNT